MANEENRIITERRDKIGQPFKVKIVYYPLDTAGEPDSFALKNLVNQIKGSADIMFYQLKRADSRIYSYMLLLSPEHKDLSLPYGFAKQDDYEDYPRFLFNGPASEAVQWLGKDGWNIEILE